MTTTATRSIYLRGHEARALLDHGRVLLVRPVKPQPHPDFLARGLVSVVPQWPAQDGVRWFMRDGLSELIKCPIGRPGDVLEFKEKWAKIGDMRPSGYWTNPKWIGREFWYEADNDKPTWGGRWMSPATMPREAIRTRRTIIDVRVKRACEMSGEDMRNCGIDDRAFADSSRSCSRKRLESRFREFYESRHGEGSWSTGFAWLIGVRKEEG